MTQGLFVKFFELRKGGVGIGKRLEKQGETIYTQTIEAMQNSEDEEIALAALFALQHRGDERALEAVEKIFETYKSEKMRKKALYILGTMDSEKSEKKLMEVAKNDEDAALRKEAIFWLGQKEVTDKIMKEIKKLSNQ